MDKVFPRAALAAALLLAMPLPAAAADLHLLWDGKCAGCHGHAGPFARKSLTVADGVLRGRRHPQDLALFLRSHNGGFAPADIDAIVAMLREQAATPDLFRQKCGRCHATAAQLAREQLTRSGGQLVGRFSHRRIADFLPGHAPLSADESAALLKTLERVEAEVHRN